MKCEITYKQSNNGMNTSTRLPLVLCCTLIILLFSFYGCSDKPASTPVKAEKKQTVKKTAKREPAPAPETVAKQGQGQEGYVYLQRDRRDPFVPLIVPKKKVQKREDIKVGTLEGYDISEFILGAIARKGRAYYALLTTPDNRSFTIHAGTKIGLNNGKVKKITRDKIVLTEYSRDIRGQLKPREVILEFSEGEVK